MVPDASTTVEGCADFVQYEGHVYRLVGRGALHEVPVQASQGARPRFDGSERKLEVSDFPRVPAKLLEGQMDIAREQGELVGSPMIYLGQERTVGRTQREGLSWLLSKRFRAGHVAALSEGCCRTRD